MATAIGFIPGVGDAIDILGAIAGRDLLTGEDISGVGVLATAAGTIFLGSGRLARQGTDAAGSVLRRIGADVNERFIAKGNLKALSRGRVKGIDAEAFKKDIVGRAGRNFNISVDEAGSVFLTPVRRGASDPVPTGFTLDELRELFPRERR